MVKKVLTVVGGILVLGVTIAVVLFVLNYTGIISKEVLNKQDVYVYTTDSGKTYTEAVWDWKPAEFKGRINYVDVSGVQTQSVALHLKKDEYCDVILPITEYIYDYGKTIWAVDGSYLIRVVADASTDNLSLLAGIDKGLALNQTTICTQDKVKGVKTVATLVNGYAIIAKVYCNDETWSVIRNGLLALSSTYTIDSISYADDYVELEKLSYVGKYTGQVVFQEVDLKQQKYLFADGALWVSSAFDKFYEAKDVYLKRLCSASGHDVEEAYSADGMFYAKSGDYYLGLIAYNNNTTIVLLGSGEEAKCNIINVMHYLK